MNPDQDIQDERVSQFLALAAEAIRQHVTNQIVAEQIINEILTEEAYSRQNPYEQRLVECALRIIDAGSMDTRSLADLRIALQCKRFSSDVSLTIAYERGYRDGTQGIRRGARLPRVGARTV